MPTRENCGAIGGKKRFICRCSAHRAAFRREASIIGLTLRVRDDDKGGIIVTDSSGSVPMPTKGQRQRQRQLQNVWDVVTMPCGK